MHVTQLSLTDIRNYHQVDARFVPGLNLIVGKNGQGKTNLVEAIAYVATLSSHRVTGDSALIRTGKDTGVIRMTVSSGQRNVLLETQINAKLRNRAQLNRNPVRPRELTRWFSCVSIVPEQLILVRGEPAIRRKFFDTVETMRNPGFAQVIADYERVVRQRTILLKSARNQRNGRSLEETLDVWDEQLVNLGTTIMFARRALLRMLHKPLHRSYAAIAQHDHAPTLTLLESTSKFLHARNVSRETSTEPTHTNESAACPTLHGITRSLYITEPVNSETENNCGYKRVASTDRTTDNVSAAADLQASMAPSEKRVAIGTPSGHPKPQPESESYVSRETFANEFRQLLRESRGKELERGACLLGPHRDDIMFTLKDLPVKGYASHGESWSFVLALQLGVAELIREESTRGDPVIILDDVFAELDAQRRDSLMSAVKRFEQVIVTAAVESDVPQADWHTNRVDEGALRDD